MTLVDRAIDASATQLRVVARDLAFAPAEVHVTAGRFVVLDLVNDDPVFHDWTVEGLANVDAATRPGETTRIRFIIDRPGRYPIRCSVAGHAAAGMVGELVVDPRPARERERTARVGRSAAGSEGPARAGSRCDYWCSCRCCSAGDRCRRARLGGRLGDVRGRDASESVDAARGLAGARSSAGICGLTSGWAARRRPGEILGGDQRVDGGCVAATAGAMVLGRDAAG